MSNKIHVMVAVTVVWAVVFGGVGVAEESILQQCSSKLPVMTTCLGFATGKDAAPQQKCCDSVKEMKDDTPACLCFMILQVHNGSNPALKSLNIQESQLLQLSSACMIANANISDCPVLLKLPSDSPDATIFNNNATIRSIPRGRPSSTSSSSSESDMLKYNRRWILQSTWIPLTFLLILPPTNMFYV